MLYNIILLVLVVFQLLGISSLYLLDVRVRSIGFACSCYQFAVSILELTALLYAASLNRDN